MAVDPYDEKQIGANETIIRRINPQQHVVWDANRKRYRITSKAYNKSSGLNDGMSVDIEKLIVAAGEDPYVYVTTPVFTGSVALAVGDVRALDLWVGYDPIKDVPNVPDNPHHGEVWTTTPKNSFNDRQKNGLARLARWYVELPDVDIA
ncbi:MAG: hypothetical protein WAS73_15100 [Defluviicoccus sp.]